MRRPHRPKNGVDDRAGIFLPLLGAGLSYKTAFAAHIHAELPVNLVQWALDNFDLPKGSSEEGRIRFERTPHIVEPLMELSPGSPTEKVIVCKPTQSAATTIGLIALSGWSDIAPGHAMLIMPTEQMAQSFSKKRLDSIINGVPALKAKIGEAKTKDASNTILQKIFPGGSILLGGSNSPAKYRSESIRYLILDDFDGFETAIGQEGSPEELADRRTGTFQGRRKIYINSTITVDGASNIQAAYEKSSQGSWQMPCPRCGELQYFEWGTVDSDFGIRFSRDENGEVTEAWYQCIHCHGRIAEHAKPTMRAGGKYVHKHPHRQTRGFKWSALQMAEGLTYSWIQLVEMFLSAKRKQEKGDDSDMITFFNTILVEPWKGTGEQPKYAELYARCEPYRALVVPAGGLMLVAGVDVQDNRLAVKLEAFGEGEESWTVYWAELYGDPGQDDVWRQLDMLLSKAYEVEGGGTMHLASVGIDSGGHHTQKVYDYCRRRQPVVFALHGASKPGRPIIGRPTLQDVNYAGETIKGGVALWPIGTDTAKSLLYNRLNNVLGSGPGYHHHYIGLSEDFFKQLTAEKLSVRFVKGFPKYEWVKPSGARNEALDCSVYSYAAALRIGMATMDWAELRRIRSGVRQKRVVKTERRPTINPFTGGR